MKIPRGQTPERQAYMKAYQAKRAKVAECLSTYRCECGCGQLTKISGYTHKSKGYVKGEPRRFAVGHSRKTGNRTLSAYLSTQHEGRQRRAHIVIVERVIGHALPPGAEVHHVDGNRQNNAHSNLVVCQDRRYHNLLHVRQRVLAAGGDPNTQRICFMCKQPKLFSELVGGATKASSSNRCRPCANQDLRNRKLERRSAMRGRVDANQLALVRHAQAFGASWVSMANLGDGCPDGLLGLHGHTFIVEFKTEKGALTDDQREFIRTWRGSPVYVLRTTEELERLLSTVVPNKRAPRVDRRTMINHTEAP